MEISCLSKLNPPPLCFSSSSSSSSSSSTFSFISSKPLSFLKITHKSLPRRPFPKPFCISSQSHPNPQNPSKTLIPSLLKSISLSLAIAAAATSVLFARFQKPSHALSTPPPAAAVESSDSVSDVSDEEREKALEEYSDSNPSDVGSLKGLMEVKIKLQKFPEAIQVLDRLILLQPKEKEWPALKAHLYLYSGDVATAKSLFEQIIAGDPFHVEAYHGLVMATAQSDPAKLEDLLKRIEKVTERCKKEKKEDFRDFKMLVAQLRVTQGKYDEALSLYQELVKEEPRDFRPYLCLGIIYTLLRKMEEAEKQFDKYRRLVPKEHPYAQYFDDNVMATKVFSQLREKEKTGSKR